jgi:hypothetical protein
MRIYISGPISASPKPLDVVREIFRSTADRLAMLGHTPVNPFDVPPHHGCACPTEDQAGAGSGHAWGCYLRGDLAAMLDCDAILMLDGWEPSHGARLELAVASACGLRVLMNLPEPAQGGVTG